MLEDPVRSDEQGRFDASSRCSFFASCRDSTGAGLTLVVSSLVCIASSYDFNQSGPETHVLPAKITGDVPRDAMSAGLSLLEQCLQAFGGTRLLISHVLNKLFPFPVFSTNPIQCYF